MPISPETQKRLLAFFEEVYQQGVADGSATAMKAIMEAARNATGALPAQPQVVGATLSATGTVSDRAPRGLLREVVTKILQERPGLTVTEVAELAPKVDTRVSARSVGGEMRRREGTYYRRAGRHWFVVQTPAPDIDGTTGAETPAAESVDDLI